MDVETEAPAARDRPVVCVLAAPAHALAACLASLCAHTPAGVDLVVAAPGADDALRAAVAAAAGERPVTVAAHGAAAVAAGAGRRDVVVCDGRHVVGAGWLDGLADAARDATVATASALTAGDGPTALGVAAGPDAADAVRRRSARLRPRLGAPAAACRLVTRAALDVAGPLDDGFAARATRAGLLHVAADDVLVVPAGEADAAPAEGAAPAERRTPRPARWRRSSRSAPRPGRSTARGSPGGAPSRASPSPSTVASCTARPPAPRSTCAR